MKNAILGTFLAAALQLPMLVSPAMAKEEAVLLSVYGSPMLSATASMAVGVAASPATAAAVGVGSVAAAGLSAAAKDLSKESSAVRQKPGPLPVDDTSITRTRPEAGAE